MTFVSVLLATSWSLSPATPFSDPSVSVGLLSFFFASTTSPVITLQLSRLHCSHLASFCWHRARVSLAARRCSTVSRRSKHAVAFPIELEPPHHPPCATWHNTSSVTLGPSRRHVTASYRLLPRDSISLSRRISRTESESQSQFFRYPRLTPLTSRDPIFEESPQHLRYQLY